MLLSEGLFLLAMPLCVRWYKNSMLLDPGINWHMESKFNDRYKTSKSNTISIIQIIYIDAFQDIFFTCENAYINVIR